MTGSTTTLTSVVPGRGYDVRVRAVSQSGNGAYSTAATQVLNTGMYVRMYACILVLLLSLSKPGVLTWKHHINCIIYVLGIKLLSLTADDCNHMLIDNLAICWIQILLCLVSKMFFYIYAIFNYNNAIIEEKRIINQDYI